MASNSKIANFCSHPLAMPVGARQWHRCGDTTDAEVSSS